MGRISNIAFLLCVNGCTKIYKTESHFTNPDNLLLETDLTTLLITMCERTCWYVKMFGYLDLPQCLVGWSFWRFTKQGSEVLQPLYFSVFSRPTFYFR